MLSIANPSAIEGQVFLGDGAKTARYCTFKARDRCDAPFRLRSNHASGESLRLEGRSSSDTKFNPICPASAAKDSESSRQVLTTSIDKTHDQGRVPESEEIVKNEGYTKPKVPMLEAKKRMKKEIDRQH